MALFTKALLLLPFPKLVVEMVDDPEPMPKSILPGALPAILQFLITLLVAPSTPLFWSQTTAEDVLVLLFTIPKSRVAALGGQTVFAVLPIEPSIVTKSAPFNRIKAPVLVPEMTNDSLA